MSDYAKSVAELAAIEALRKLEERGFAPSEDPRVTEAQERVSEQEAARAAHRAFCDAGGDAGEFAALWPALWEKAKGGAFLFHRRARRDRRENPFRFAAEHSEVRTGFAHRRARQDRRENPFPFHRRARRDRRGVPSCFTAERAEGAERWEG